MHEYDKVYKKDTDGNKDLNKLAIHDLKKAHYFFAYMRTSEKLYNAELRRKAQLAKDSEEPPTELEIIAQKNSETQRDRVLSGLTNKQTGQLG